MMIAAAHTEHKAVWGIGPTPSAAMQDARKEFDNKIEISARIGEPNPFPKTELDELTFIPFKNDADLSGDGADLYTQLDWNLHTEMTNNEVGAQGDLF